VSTLKVIRNSSLLTIGIAESISQIGDWISMMAVFAMLVFKGGGGVIQSSGVFLAGLLPTLLTSPFAGWLCDRFDRKYLMIASQIISGMIISGLIFTTRIEIIYLLLALEAATLSIMAPARQTVLPDLVAREELTQANAFLQQLTGIIKVSAPALAGLILSAVAPDQAIILVVISFGVAALILFRLPSLPPRPRVETVSIAPSPTPALHDKRQLLPTAIRDVPELGQLFLSMFLGIFVIVGFDVLSSVYFRDILHENEGFYGLAIGLVGVGTLMATFLLMLRKTTVNPWRDVVTGIILLSMIALTMAIAAGLTDLFLARWIVLAGCLIGGIGNGLINVQVTTLLQTLTPASILGQISGFFQSTTTAGQLLGIVLTPLLVPGLLSMSNYFTLSTVALLVPAGYIAVQLIIRERKQLADSRMVK